jgi:hypothetical protein
MADANKEHIDRLNHMLGMNTERPGWRNIFVCPEDEPLMLEMQESGLVALRVKSSSFFGGSAIWRATPEGRELVGAPALHEEK